MADKITRSPQFDHDRDGYRIIAEGYQVTPNGYATVSSVRPPVPSGGSSAIRPFVY